MGKLKGFIEYERTDEGLIPVKKRVKNYKEFTLKPSDDKLKEPRWKMYGLWCSILSFWLSFRKFNS